MQVGAAWRCAGSTEAFVDDRLVYRAIGEFTYRTATAYLSVKLRGTFIHLVGRVLAMGAQRHKLCSAHGRLAVFINFGYVSPEDLSKVVDRCESPDEEVYIGTMGIK